MPRRASPWYRASRDEWYVGFKGKQVALGVKGKENKAAAIIAWEKLTGRIAAVRNPQAFEADPLRRKQLAVAYHDAGHVVVATLLGHTVHELKLVVGNPGRDGFFIGTGQDDPFSCECNTTVGLPVITPMLAGRVAEVKAGFGNVYPGGDINDLESAANIAAQTAPTPEQADSLLAESHTAVVALLNQPAVWAGVEKLAVELLRVGQLSREDVARTLTAIEGWASAVQWATKTHPAIFAAAKGSGGTKTDQALSPSDFAAGLGSLVGMAKVSRLVGELGSAAKLSEIAEVVKECGGVDEFAKTVKVVAHLLEQKPDSKMPDPSKK